MIFEHTVKFEIGVNDLFSIHILNDANPIWLDLLPTLLHLLELSRGLLAED